jgi:hypothetical protein
MGAMNRPFSHYALSGFALLALAAALPRLQAAPMPTPPPPISTSVASAPVAPLTVEVAGLASSLPVLARFLEPGATVEIAVVGSSGLGPFVGRAGGGELSADGPGRWRFQAPDAPGHVDIEIEDLADREIHRIVVFVLTPYRGEAALDGFRIGQYPLEPYRNLAAYRRPPGLLAVRSADLALRVSPHFELGQFVCKQKGVSESGGISYLSLRTELLIALENLLAEVRGAGIPASTLSVMSGYRTPYYNQLIGNETLFSRHTYGDAADVFVDRDGDGRMDDLDRNGKVDAADAKLLFDLAEGLAAKDLVTGGLGLYSPKPHRGPFVHIDTRGFPARWRS